TALRSWFCGDFASIQPFEKKLDVKPSIYSAYITTQRRHEDWDTARLPKPKQGKSRGRFRGRTTDPLIRTFAFQPQSHVAISFAPEPARLYLRWQDGSILEPIDLYTVVYGACAANQVVISLKSMLYFQGRYRNSSSACKLPMNRPSSIVCRRQPLEAYRPVRLHWVADMDARNRILSIFEEWQPVDVHIFLYEYERYLPYVESIPTRHSAGTPPLYKLLAPYILPEDVKKIIALDSDVLFNYNVLNLWKEFGQFKSGQSQSVPQGCARISVRGREASSQGCSIRIGWYSDQSRHAFVWFGKYSSKTNGPLGLQKYKLREQTGSHVDSHMCTKSAINGRTTSRPNGGSILSCKYVLQSDSTNSVIDLTFQETRRGFTRRHYSHAPSVVFTVTLAFGAVCEQVTFCPYSCPKEDLPFPTFGINTDVLLMDLAELRRINWWQLWRQEVLKEVNEWGFLPAGEQKVISQVMSKYIQLYHRLRCEWNIQIFRSDGINCCPIQWVDRLPDETECISGPNHMRLREQARLIHYNTRTKLESCGSYTPSPLEFQAGLEEMSLQQLRHRYFQVHNKFRNMPTECLP
ncbi:hypothetical protein T265_12830, partial [Opisthorchis viverrini]